MLFSWAWELRSRHVIPDVERQTTVWITSVRGTQQCQHRRSSSHQGLQQSQPRTVNNDQKEEKCSNQLKNCSNRQAKYQALITGDIQSKKLHLSQAQLSK